MNILASHPLVREIIIINDAPSPFHFTSDKVKVLEQNDNIFVNPAWNLGASEASEELLVIANDDIVIESDILFYARRLIESGRYGIVGPDITCLSYDGVGPVTHRWATSPGPGLTCTVLVPREVGDFVEDGCGVGGEAGVRGDLFTGDGDRDGLEGS